MKRRTLVQAGAVVLTLGVQHLGRGAGIVNVRIWPAPEYSRVTIESDAALVTKQLFVPNPPRLAVDVEGISLNSTLKELVAKVRADDPNIAGIRVGQFTAKTVRLVIDLKHAIRPQVFALAPVAAYQHRLVLDLYPERTMDPLDALLAEAAADWANPPVDRSGAAAGAVAALDTDPLGALIAQHGKKSMEAAAPDSAPQSVPQRRWRANPVPPQRLQRVQPRRAITRQHWPLTALSSLP